MLLNHCNMRLCRKQGRADSTALPIDPSPSLADISIELQEADEEFDR